MHTRAVCVQLPHHFFMATFSFSCVQSCFSTSCRAVLSSEPRFALKVLVRDEVTRQPLPGASVGVYMNHTLTGSAQTGATGEALLWVLYVPGISLTLVGDMEGYVPSPLPWSTAKKPGEWQNEQKKPDL